MTLSVRISYVPSLRLFSIFCKTKYRGMIPNSMSANYRDDSKYYEMIGTGSFQTLLYFRVESVDAILTEHFDTSQKIPLKGQMLSRMIYLAVLE